MKATHYILLPLVAAQALCVLNAQAADSTISINASVVASSCTVTTTSTTIPLGNIQANTLLTAKQFSPWSDTKDILLTACPSSTTMVNATFSGVASTDDLNGYKNTTSAGPQTVSVQLAKADGTLLKNGDSYGDVNVATGAAKFTVKARLYTEKGLVLPGAVTSAIDLTFQYK